MKKEVRVIRLPTDKAQDSIVDCSGTLHYFNGVFTQDYLKSQGKESYHLYLVDDSEIKEGDWYTSDTDTVRQAVTSDSDYWAVRPDYKKIIATTDTKLRIGGGTGRREDGVSIPLPCIPQSFIEEYCKNPVDKVMVGYEVFGYTHGNFHIRDRGFSIEIPDTAEDKRTYKLKLTSDNCIITHPVKEKMYTQAEVDAIRKEEFRKGMNA